MTRRWAAYVVAGGMLGASLRWAVVEVVGVGHPFPWAVFAVNLTGCALLGVVTGVARSRPRRRPFAVDLLGVGFCGGLTTMSTFALEISVLGRDGEVAIAASYLVSSVVLGIAAAWLGAELERRWRGVLR